jgi:hypothetical protein
MSATSRRTRRRRSNERATAETRRFKPPWSIEESSACFIVRDHDKQALAYVYFQNEPGRRSSGKLLTRDEAFLIAVNIDKLPSAIERKKIGVAADAGKNPGNQPPCRQTPKGLEWRI